MEGLQYLPFRPATRAIPLPTHPYPAQLRMRWLALAALLICAVTWLLDLTDLVYHCPYCRTRRTAIGLLGLLMLLHAAAQRPFARSAATP